MDNPRRRRPVQRQLKFYEGDVTNTSYVQHLLYEATYPCTAQGLRWAGSVFHLSVITNRQACMWTICVVREGEDVPVVTFIEPFVQPQEDCMAFGIQSTAWTAPSEAEFSPTGPTMVNFEGTSNSQRRLQPGDRLIFTALTDHLVSTYLQIMFSFFIKA